MDSEEKSRRVLEIYAKLSAGCVVNKAEEAQNYGVSERSIERDLKIIRTFLECDVENTGILNSVEFDKWIQISTGSSVKADKRRNSCYLQDPFGQQGFLEK